jgi:sugar lactone lactonase YvrE
LFEVDPASGAFKQIVADDKGINAFCYAPDGHVYGPHGLWGTDVLRIDLESGEVTSIHDVNLASSVRYNPRDEHLYVLAAESATRAILVRMALDGSDYSVFARMSDQPDAFMTSADNFAIAPDGTFYVTRFLAPIITRISADGTDIQDFAVGQKP